MRLFPAANGVREEGAWWMGCEIGACDDDSHSHVFLILINLQRISILARASSGVTHIEWDEFSLVNGPPAQLAWANHYEMRCEIFAIQLPCSDSCLATTIETLPFRCTVEISRPTNRVLRALSERGNSG